MLEHFCSIEFRATVQKAMEKTVKGIVAEQKTTFCSYNKQSGRNSPSENDGCSSTSRY